MTCSFTVISSYNMQLCSIQRCFSPALSTQLYPVVEGQQFVFYFFSFGFLNYVKNAASGFSLSELAVISAFFFTFGEQIV